MDTSRSAKHHLSLCFTQNAQLQNNTMTLHYYSSLNLDTAFSHKETPRMHQVSLPDFADTFPKLNGLPVNHPPKKSALKSSALEIFLPQSSSQPPSGKHTPHPHQALHLNTHPHNLGQCRRSPLQALLPPSPSCSSLLKEKQIRNGVRFTVPKTKGKEATLPPQTHVPLP